MWAYNSVFYQIYPIGFCGAPYANDGICVSRILKIGEWADYLKELGVDAILLNPIFDSDNHGYDTRDFRTIDALARIKILQMSAAHFMSMVSASCWTAYSIM